MCLESSLVVSECVRRRFRHLGPRNPSRHEHQPEPTTQERHDEARDVREPFGHLPRTEPWQPEETLKLRNASTRGVSTAAPAGMARVKAGGCSDVEFLRRNGALP